MFKLLLVLLRVKLFRMIMFELLRVLFRELERAVARRRLR